MCSSQSGGFGERGYTVFFWEDYLNKVEDVSLHSLKVDRKGGEEKWITAPAPETHPDYRGGGTYRNVDAQRLPMMMITANQQKTRYGSLVQIQSKERAEMSCLGFPVRDSSSRTAK